MSLSRGARLGPFEILDLIGAGGMGEVYRARDTTLNRDVAIKVLPTVIVADPERFRRFRREAQVLASLNHPAIAQIYGFEESGPSHAIVLELVDGPTLAERLAQGTLRVPEVLSIAKQIAEALEAAHDAGVIHRDLKPGNIALTAGGHVKVLDFGLAKTVDAGAASSVGLTLTQSATLPGTVLGTAAYMSPEQARGQPVDKRTDIWAFGCVLFEALTGRRAFAGQTISDTLAAVIEREPDWQALPPAAPPQIAWLLRRCLQKDSNKRLHDIADARIELDETISGRAAVAVPASSSSVANKERVLWAVLAVTLLALLGFFVMRGIVANRAAAPPRVLNASIVLPDGVHLASVNAAGRFSLSPDGRFLVMAASDQSGKTMLWLRSLGSRAAQPLEGTEGAAFPFWSPDSQQIGFIADRKLKKIAASGGDVTTLCDAPFGATSAWNRDGTILFTPGGNAPLSRVPSSGGTPAPVTQLNAATGEFQHSYPFFLPDGRHFLYLVVGSKTAGLTGVQGTFLGSLDAGDVSTLVIPGGSNAKYADGHLVFVRGGKLQAQPFDLDRLALAGDARPLVEQVQVAGAATTGVPGSFSVSQTGLLTYQTGLVVQSQLAWFNREGTAIGTLGEAADYGDVSLSPDDSRVAVSLLDSSLGSRDLWIFDVARGLRERFTFDPGDDFGPNWSREGPERIVFSARRGGSIDLYEKRTDGSAAETLLLADPMGKFNPRFSSDGRYVFYVAGGGIIGRSEIWALTLAEKKSAAVINTRFVQTQPQLSPDGRWLAYASDESGRFEVYVTSFPAKTGRWRVSTAGGGWPRWNPGGKEIFYLATNNDLVAVPVTVSGSEFQLGAARTLFNMRARPWPRLDAYAYDVTADGRRFIVNTLVESSPSDFLTLVVNWPSR